MSQAPITYQLSSDKARTDPENEDSLGYAPFAKYLADSIVRMTPQDGIVLGLYAPWGSGKTTLLNFVQDYLKKHDEKERPVVIPFNPWWFSGQEDLACSFFRLLLSALNNDNRVGEPVRKAVERYADFVGQGFGVAASVVSAAMGLPVPPAAAGSAITHGMKLFAPGERSVNDLKADVEKALRDSQTKLLIIIDDIDRLTAEEIRQLFRVIKAVADFPNVIYLLAFDRAVAVKALESVQGGNGEDYLEKIIQVPFELPLSDSTSLQQMLFQRLDMILGNEEDSTVSSSSLFDLAYWANVSREGIYPFIKTPRDVVRLTNTLSVTYASVRGEVNPVDFIAIETLRVFVPSVYNVVRNNESMFAGPSERVQDYEKQAFKDFHNAWFDEVQDEDKEAIKNLMLRLFPKTRFTWDLNWSRSDDPDRWRRFRRVAHSDVFPVFFRLAVPTNDLTNQEMQYGLRLAGNDEEFATLILRLQETRSPDGTSRARRFLERLEDYTDSAIPKSAIPSVVQALCNIGDTLQANEGENRRSTWDFGIDLRIARIIYQLLRRLTEPERYDVLKNAFLRSGAYYIVANEVMTLGQQHGKFGSSERSYEQTVTAEHLAELERFALEQVRNRIKLDDFTMSLSLRRLLAMWKEWGSVQEVSDWLQKTVETDDGLLNILTNFLSQSRSESSDSPLVRVTPRLDPFWFKPYLEPEAIRERVQHLAQREDLTDNQRLAVMQFLQEYEDREAGRNPDDVFYTPRRTVFDRMGVKRDLTDEDEDD